MVFKWQDNHTILVLDLLKDHECLWNVKSDKYRSKNTRDRSIDEIIEELKFHSLTREDIKLKIKSIRSRYSAELSKVLSSKSSGEVYVPKLFWFRQADTFLRAVCNPRISSATAINKLKYSKEVSVNEDYTHKVENGIGDIYPSIISKPQEPVETRRTKRPLSAIQTVNTAIGTGHFGIIRSKSVIKEPRKSEIDNDSNYGTIRSFVSEIVNTASKLPKKKSTHENEFDFFGKSLAVQLKNMPVHRALICQQKLQQVMMDERMFQLKASNTRNSSPSPGGLPMIYNSARPSAIDDCFYMFDPKKEFVRNNCKREPGTFELLPDDPLF